MQAQLFPSKEMKIELIRWDLNVSDIARHLGVSRSAVSQVIHNLGYRSERAEWIRFFLERIFDDMQAGEFTKLKDYHV